jgi:hypothetical protein
MIKTLSNGKKNKPRAFIHMGYPKTASSYLQQRLFRSHPDINYPMLEPEFAQHIYDLSLSNNSEEIFQNVKSRNFGDFLIPDKVNIISSEGITDPDKLAPRNGAYNHLNRIIGDLSDLLDSFGFEAHFLVVTRKQSEALISRYAEKYRSFIPIDEGFRDPKEFYNCLMGPSKNLQNLRSLYNYKATVDILRNNDVDFTILTYEEFAVNRVQFIKKLSGVLRIDKIYAKAICGEGGKRVSPKLSRNEYLAYYQSKVTDKLDVQESIALDKKAKYCESDEFLKNDRHIRKLINYYRLHKITNEPVPYRSIEEFLNDDNQQTVALSEDQVKNIKSYYSESNKLLDNEFKLGLTEAGYF